MSIRLRYNAPTSLTFSLITILLLIIDIITPGYLQLNFFSVGPSMHIANPLDWFRLFTHILGHASIEHLLANLAFILLLGPILEEKYGSVNMVIMIVVTAITTGAASILLSDVALMGASGIVFMMILLASFSNVQRGDLPLSFLLVVLIYLLREVLAAFQADTISQLAHIVGGASGSVFGFLLSSRKSK